MPSEPLRFHFQILYWNMPDTRGVAEHSARIEELGFDGISIVDSSISRGPGYDPFIALAHASAVTKKVWLSTGVYLLPLTNPIRLAKEIATLDYLSGGRVILGIGLGGESPEQYKAYGVPLSERRSIASEYIEILKGLWTQDSFTYHGRYYSFDNISMDPKPVQKPHPPIWVGGRIGGVEIGPDGQRRFKSKTGAIKRAAKYGDGWIPHYMTPETYQSSVEQILSYAASYGRPENFLTRAHLVQFLVRDSMEDALAELGRRERYGEARGREFSQRYDAVGSPKDCIKKLEDFAAVGVQHFILHPMCQPGERNAQMERIAKEVLPHFR